MSRIKRILILSLAAIGLLAVMVIVVLVIIVRDYTKPRHGRIIEEMYVTRTLNLEGTIRVAEQPAAGCQVCVKSPGPIMKKVATAFADEEGHYELALSAAQRLIKYYSLWVKMSVSPEVDLIASTKLPQKSLSEDINSHFKLNLTIPFRKGTFDLKAVVRDKDGLPYPGEMIELHARNRSFYLTKRLDADGTAMFKDLESDYYHLQCLVPKRNGESRSDGIRTRTETDFACLDVSLKSSITDPMILIPGGSGNESVQGRLMLNGKPLPAVQVILTYDYGEYWRQQMPWYSLTETGCELYSRTDSDGMYIFPELPDVKAKLNWKLDKNDRFLEGSRKIHTTMHVQDVDISATASISGKIERRGITGSEIPSVKLTATRLRSPSISDISTFNMSTWTTNQGDFLFDRLPAGDYMVYQPAGRNKKKVKSMRLHLKEGEVYELVMKWGR